MADQEQIELIKKRYNLHSHYYGDIVRGLFFAAAIIMLAVLPFSSARLPVTSGFSLIVIIALGLFAGLTSPTQKGVITINVFISIIAIFVFEYEAVKLYQAATASDWLFWVDQALAIIFLAALYYSTKTVRAMTLENNQR